jgi:hypothetical protein
LAHFGDHRLLLSILAEGAMEVTAEEMEVTGAMEVTAERLVASLVKAARVVVRAAENYAGRIRQKSAGAEGAAD